MNSRLEQAPLGHLDSPTVLQPAAPTAARPKVCCPKRDASVRSEPHLTTETQALLRLRLRAAAFILLVGFGVFLVRHVAGVLLGEPLDPLLLASHVLVVLVLGLCAARLCRH
jgi:hypothetical protein